MMRCFPCYIIIIIIIIVLLFVIISAVLMCRPFVSSVCLCRHVDTRNRVRRKQAAMRAINAPTISANVYRLCVSTNYSAPLVDYSRDKLNSLRSQRQAERTGAITDDF